MLAARSVTRTGPSPSSVLSSQKVPGSMVRLPRWRISRPTLISACSTDSPHQDVDACISTYDTCMLACIEFTAAESATCMLQRIYGFTLDRPLKS